MSLASPTKLVTSLATLENTTRQPNHTKYGASSRPPEQAFFTLDPPFRLSVCHSIHTNQRIHQVTIFEIAKALKENKDTEMHSKLDTLTTLISVLQPQDLKAEHDRLAVEDRRNQQLTSEDPSYDEMVKRHEKAMEAAEQEEAS